MPMLSYMVAHCQTNYVSRVAVRAMLFATRHASILAITQIQIKWQHTYTRTHIHTQALTHTQIPARQHKVGSVPKRNPIQSKMPQVVSFCK